MSAITNSSNRVASRRSKKSGRRVSGLVALGFVVAVAVMQPGVAKVAASKGMVFSLSNAPWGNSVLVFRRNQDGSLEPGRPVFTGGKGTGDGLGNQGALALSDSGKWLLAVNPGSDSITVFLVTGERILRREVQPSLGEQPISVTIENDLVYVLNAGSDAIQGFRLDAWGRLTPIAHSRRKLSGNGVGAAQVSFNRDGDLLAVTEKATNRVVTFEVDGDGRPGEANVYDSPAPTPFGFAFGRRDQMLVSEAAGGATGASTLSSWQLAGDGSASLISAAVPSQQSAACWVAVSRDGHLAYVTNTRSDNVSTYAVADNGSVGLAEAAAGQTGSGSAPTDIALDRNNRFLYTLNPGNGTISAFSVDETGVLQLVEHQVVNAGSGRVTGLVAR
ncbi:beta-propeller fold lactonase family protein [Lysobacter maris]|uniref:Beta-propeller fold lactonase family protein n=1 Tax=Marilutibacter maris TaxID=1605891 RepID=A0A507ZZV5_9GAMM|nr:beta-propeller fold lactonase family protein [Lysobacter maris]KAB8168501.1 beta-propeller fold lactonase family protein [Lysobacter maris]